MIAVMDGDYMRYFARASSEEIAIQAKREILSEVFRLIEEQERALQGRLSTQIAAQCERRSCRIIELLQQAGCDKT